ncbi:MAG: LysE family translocator [Bacillota bacterium]
MGLLRLSLIAFAVGLSGAITPGPLLSVVISSAITGGLLAGMAPVLAHGTLELGMVTALKAGLAAVLAVPFLKRAIALVGGLMLGYMGYTMVVSARHLTAPRAAEGCAESQGACGPRRRSLGTVNEATRRAFTAGMVATGSSPFWFLWWTTVGASSITMAGGGLAAASAFFVGHFLADLVWYGLVTVAVVLGRRALSDSIYRGLIQGCGVFLILMGAYYVFSIVG